MLLERFEIEKAPSKHWIPNGVGWGRIVNARPLATIEKGVDVARDQPYVQCQVSRPTGFNAYRAEISGGSHRYGAPGVTCKYSEGDEIWVGFSCYTLSKLHDDIPLGEVIWQVQTSAGIGTFAQPPVSIVAVNGKLYLDHRTDPLLDRNLVYLGDCPVDTVIHLVIHLKFSHGLSGETEVWFNDKRVYTNLASPNLYSDASQTGFLKFGTYLPDLVDRPEAPEVESIWRFTAFLIGDGEETYESISHDLKRPMPRQTESLSLLLNDFEYPTF